MGGEGEVAHLLSAYDDCARPQRRSLAEARRVRSATVHEGGARKHHIVRWGREKKILRPEVRAYFSVHPEEVPRGARMNSLASPRTSAIIPALRKGIMCMRSGTAEQSRGSSTSANKTGLVDAAQRPAQQSVCSVHDHQPIALGRTGRLRMRRDT